jgi:hypothetical protein
MGWRNQLPQVSKQKIQVAGSSETLTVMYQIVRHYFTESHNLIHQSVSAIKFNINPFTVHFQHTPSCYITDHRGRAV